MDSTVEEIQRPTHGVGGRFYLSRSMSPMIYHPIWQDPTGAKIQDRASHLRGHHEVVARCLTIESPHG